MFQWLGSEALVNNPKIEVTPDNKFLFKATYKIRDRKSLLRLLKQQDLKGLGGILLEDIQESLPHSDKALKVCSCFIQTYIDIFLCLLMF